MEMLPKAVKDREWALEAAEACIRLLKEQFGARRVILFGSVAGQGVWHGGSDIDLAVEGIAPAEFLRAYSACRELLPPEIDLDLIPLERAYPELRARVLGEVKMPDDPIQAIKAVVEDELVALGRAAQEMHDLLAACTKPPTRTELRAVASILHEFYNGVERIFERIAVGADLLAQMATAREGVRPPVVDEPLRARLKEYLDFRHFYRHAYGYTLEWSHLRWKAESLSETLTRLREQLHAFFEALTA